MPLAASRFSRLLPLIVASAVPILAQGVSAQLSGFVLTKDGSPVAGAAIVVRNTETGFSRVVTTDARGRYLASILPVGPYSVTVTKEGFQTASGLKVNLNLGDAAPLNIRLAAVAGATVEVVASTVMQVDSERASTATFVSPDALANLPILNRSFTSLATLTPQVTVDSQRGNLAIGGQRGINTSINIDGGDTNEPFFGGAMGAAEGKTPFTISIEAIREYQVVTDGASAEFGRMGGGYLNAITKNGTNELAGSLFYYKRPQSLVARQPNLNNKPDSNKVGDFKQDQFGFSVGGPIIPDKLFYFVAYDGQRRTDPVNFIFGGASAVTLDSTLYPKDAALISRGRSYDPKADSDTFFARFDWNLSVDHQIQFRINRSDFKGDAYTAGGGYLNTYENSISDDIKTLSLVGQWNWMINANLLNEVRFNYGKDEMPRKTRASIPQVDIKNVGTYGANQYPRDYETKRLQLTESLSYVTPVFQIKGGFDINRISVAETFSSTWQGAYYFSSLANFRAGNWSDYTQRFSMTPGLSGWEAGKFDATEDQIAAYIQGDVRLGNDVKVGLGIRWDRQTHPDFPIADFSNPMATSMPLTAKVPTDNQFSPRLSFTWTPSFDRATVVRGSLGRYVSTTPSVFLYQVYTLNGARMASIKYTAAAGSLIRGALWDANNPYAFPDYATALSAGGAAATSDIFSFAPNFKNPRTDRANVQVERGFESGWVFGLSGAYAKSTQLQRLTDLNLGQPTLVSGRYIFPSAIVAPATTPSPLRPNANFARLGLYVSDAEGIYHAYTVSAKYQKDGSPFFAQVFYTYAIDKDNDSNERNFSGYSQQNTQRLGDDWSYSDRDRRHVLTGAFSYHERSWTGIQVGFSFRYLSGTPYSMNYGTDLNYDGAKNDRLFVAGMDTGRNSVRKSSNTTLDMKLSRDFRLYKKVRLAISADVFNILNRHDQFLYQKVDSSSSDAVPVISVSNDVVGSARQVQLGARLSF